MQQYKLSYKGHSWWIKTDNDHMAKSLANGKPYEFEMLRYITDKYRGVFVDVGAHQGSHSIFVEKFGDFDVYAFEPITSNFKVLRENVGLNGVDITTYQYALSDKPGFLAFDVLKDKGSLNWQVVKSTKNPKNIVQARTLDSFDFKINVLKIDVEGHEVEVLRGAENTIKKHKPVIFVEEDFKRLDVKPIDDYLKSLGYEKGKRFNATPTFEWKYKVK